MADRDEQNDLQINDTVSFESKISRRKLLASLGLAGVALATGMSFDSGTASAAASSTIQVYDVKTFAGSDTVAIQAAIDQCSTDGGGIVYFPSATYLITSTIIIKSKVTLLGAGPTSIIKADSLLPASSEIILNQTTSGTINTYYDHHIKICQLTFEGNSSTTRITSLLGFAKATNIVIDDCTFQNNSHMGIAFGGCYAVDVQNSRFLNLGRPKPSTVSAPAIWADRFGDGSFCKTIHIDNCFFTNNNWSGCYFMPKGGRISNSTFINNGESSIFTSSIGSDLQYNNNYIEGAQRSNISASGLECGASNILIYGNEIKNCQNDGISLTDVQNAVISNNIISDNGQDKVTYPTSAGIGIITYQSSPNLQPNDIKITNNRIMDKQAVKSQVYGIAIGGIGLPVTNVAISSNDLNDFKTAAIYMDSAKWGAGCYTENNLGHPSEHAQIGEFLSPITSGNFIITGVGFRPRRLEFRATLPGGQVYECESLFVLNQGICHWRAIKSGTALSSTVTNKAIALYDNLGGLICESTLNSRDIDGFTLTFTNTSARPWVSWIAYP